MFAGVEHGSRVLPGRWLCRLVLAAAIAWGAAAGADAARTLYASPDTAPGDPTATGGALRPYALVDAVTALRAGDTLYLLPGAYRTEGVSIDNVDDVLIATAPGSGGRAVLRGDVPIPSSAWQRESDIIWTTALAAPPQGVVWNWDTNLTELSEEDIELGRVQRNFGHLREASSLYTLGIIPGSWWWSEGVLRVHPPPGAIAPDAGDSYAWLRSGVAMRPLNCNRLTIRDIDFALWTQFSNNAGYSVKFTNCADSVVENSVSRDSGWHAYGAVGFPNGGVTIRNCESRGQRTDGGRFSNPFVFANTVRSAGPVAGFLGERLTHHAYGLLDWQGQPLTSGYKGLSLLSHGTLGSSIRDVEWRRVSVMTYDAEPLCQLVSAGDSAGPTLPSDPAAYEARVLDSEIRSANPNVGGPVSVSRTAFDIRPGRVWSKGAPSAMAVSGETTLFSACTFVFDMSHAPFGRLFRVRNGGRLLLQHSSFYSISLVEDGGSGTTDRERGTFGVLEDAGTELIATNCVFVRDQTAPFFTDDTPNATGVQTRDCWYARLYFEPENAPGSASGVDWSSASIGDEVVLADPGGVYNDTPGLVAPERGDFSAPASAPIRLLRRPADAAAIRMGINGEPYSGHFGAHQYGWSVCPGDRSGDRRVDGADLGIVLSRWQTDDPVADLNTDGVVDGADLGLLLANWGPCPSE